VEAAKFAKDVVPRVLALFLEHGFPENSQPLH
jgi:hypothetical protein